MSANKNFVRFASVALGLLVGLASLSGAATGVSTAAASGAPVFTDNSVISTGAAPLVATYTAQSTGQVDVLLTDLGAVGQQAGLQLASPLLSVNLAVTSNGAIVNAVTSGSTTTPATLSAPGTVSFAATAGTSYQIRVVGAPDSTAIGESGSVAVALTDHATATALQSFSGAFQVPLPKTPITDYLASVSFTVAQPGDYVVSLTDQQVPGALAALEGFVLQGTTAITAAGSPIQAGTPATLSGLAAGTYQLWVYAQAGTSGGGLFGVNVAPQAGGTALVNASTPVGALVAANTNVANASAQTLTLTEQDFQAPAALATLVAAVTSGSALLGSVTPTSRSTSFAAPAGTLQVWALATPAAGSAGAYALSLGASGATPIYSTVSVASAPSATVYPYVVTLPSAGSYSVTLNDLQFPQQFASASYALYQGGTQIATGNAGASAQTATAAAGTAVLVVTATPPSGGSGLFYAAIAPASGGAIFAQTQAVGEAFITRSVSIATAGTYDFVLSDLAWPATFSSLQVAFTQGGTLVGKVIGSGTLQGVNASAGTYTATILGVPATTATAGMYNLSIGTTAPVATLTASPTALTAGSSASTTLTWTSTGTQSCTGSTTGPAPSPSKFAGTLPTSGSATDTSFTTAGTVTYTLTCTGAGGSVTQTASVTVSAATTGSGGGGGGALGLLDVALLAGALGLRQFRRHVGV